MKRVLVVLSISMLTLFSYGQSYQTAIGLKGGNVGGGVAGGGGFNIKHFFAGSNAIEATVGLGRYHFNAQALYEWQHGLDESIGLDWYVGLGGTVGSWRGTWTNHPVYGNTYSRGFYLGANGAVGLDWNLESVLNLPLDIAVDVGPYFGIINSGAWGWGGGFALRYILQ
tara:strand:+ start:59620 stop:60126 length:507 start_codon:yes stop_codon:yes gene_type:complete